MAEVAVPIPASTVVLVRPDRQGGFTVLMNRRPEKMQTYAGVYVFPGGCVEPADYSPEMISLTQGLAPADAKATLNSNLEPEVCLGHWVAAIRELFEEAGVHFFVDSRNGNSDHRSVLKRLLGKRNALQTGKLSLAALLTSEVLRCNLSRLRYFFHRITPEHYKVRFDTRFFLAALPMQQEALPSSEEVAESLWITPQAALDRSQSGGFPMMPPTVSVLRTLADQESWHELRAAFRF